MKNVLWLSACIKVSLSYDVVKEVISCRALMEGLPA